MLGEKLRMWADSVIHFLFINHVMKIYYGLDTAVLQLMETRKSNSSSLDTHELDGMTACK